MVLVPGAEVVGAGPEGGGAKPGEGTILRDLHAEKGYICMFYMSKKSCHRSRALDEQYAFRCVARNWGRELVFGLEKNYAIFLEGEVNSVSYPSEILCPPHTKKCHLYNLFNVIHK